MLLSEKIISSFQKHAEDPVVEKYFDWVSQFTPSDARKKIQELTFHIERVMGRAQRQEMRRDWDGTKIEQICPVQIYNIQFVEIKQMPLYNMALTESNFHI